MIYTAQYVIVLMRADTLRGQVGGDWALEIDTFLSPIKWHQAIRRVPFWAQRTRNFQGQPLLHVLAQVKDLPTSKAFSTEPDQSGINR